MSSPVLSAVDAFRSCLPVHPTRSSFANELAGLTICSWNTPWIQGFRLPENDDLVISRHREGSRDVRTLCGDVVSASRSEPGCMTAIPPEQAHAFVVTGEVSFDTIHVSRRHLRSVSKRIASGDMLAFRFAFHDAFVDGCIDAILGEVRAPGPQCETFISAVTESLLLHLLRSSSSGTKMLLPSPRSAVERVRALIDRNIERSWSVNELAEEAGMSRSHLSRRFRAEVGVTLHHYQLQRRIEEAQRLLRESRMSLVEIAGVLGFCNQSHFTSVFRSIVGLPPGKVRTESKLENAPSLVHRPAGSTGSANVVVAGSRS